MTVVVATALIAFVALARWCFARRSIFEYTGLIEASDSPTGLCVIIGQQHTTRGTTTIRYRNVSQSLRLAVRAGDLPAR